MLLEVLGQEFDGVLGCDYYSAYRKYMRLNDNVLLQFCLAPFIRDVKFLAEHPERKNRTYGKRLVENLRELFGIIHRRDEYSSKETFLAALENARNDLVWNATINSPGTREALALSLSLEARFHMHTESYFRFIFIRRDHQYGSSRDHLAAMSPMAHGWRIARTRYGGRGRFDRVHFARTCTSVRRP